MVRLPWASVLKGVLSMAYSRNAKTRRDSLAGMLFVTPTLLGVLAFTVFPVLASLAASFTNWNFLKGLNGLKFVGLTNYVRMLTDEWFTGSLRNNLLFTIVVVPATLAIAAILAVIVNDRIYAKGAVRAMIFMPHISSVVAISFVWLLLLEPKAGPINRLLMALGIDHPPGWLASTSWALPGLMIMSIWAGIGYNMIIYLAALQGIPGELYEASALDGATGWRKFWYITLPMVRPSTFFLAITGIIGSFKVFGAISVMTQGGPGTSTSVVAYYVYQSGFRFMKMGYASAMAWVLFAIIFVVTLIQWIYQKRLSY